MKITLSAAMRARDVSRPRPEQLAAAAARDEPRGTADDGARAPASAARDVPQPRGRRRRRRAR